MRDVSGRGAGGDPLTMSIRPIGTHRQMETQKFRSLVSEASTHGVYKCSRRVCPPRSVLVIFTRQTISRGIESSGFIIRDRRITIRVNAKPLRNVVRRFDSESNWSEPIRLIAIPHGGNENKYFAKKSHVRINGIHIS